MTDQLSILFAKDASQYLEKDQVQEALKLCERGVKEFPVYTEGHFILARCYEKNDQQDDAAREYERVLNFMPGHLGSINALARLHFHKAMYQVGNQLKLSAYLYHSDDEKLARFLTRENILPLSPQTDDDPANVAENAVTPEPVGTAGEVLDLVDPHDDNKPEITPPVSEDESVVYEPEREELPVSPEPEQLFNSPEIDRFIAGDEDASSRELELLQNQDFAVPEVVEEKAQETEPPVFMEDETAKAANDLIIDESLFASPEKKQSLPGEADGQEEKVDLSRYANTQDDFSTVMDDMFVPNQEQEAEEDTLSDAEKDGSATEPETTQMAEERPILDTSIIFLEKKQEDVPENKAGGALEAESESAGSIQDDNSLASDLTNIPSPGLKEELPISGPASTGNSKADDLSNVIGKIEQANVERQGAVEKETQEPQVLDSTAVFEMSHAVEDESVNIEDIMSNPSLLTPTFGEILIAQKKFDNARHVFIELLKNEPENPRLKKKVEFLDKLVAMNK